MFLYFFFSDIFFSYSELFQASNLTAMEVSRDEICNIKLLLAWHGHRSIIQGQRHGTDSWWSPVGPELNLQAQR